MGIVQHLVADTFGSHIGKYSERLRLTKGSETLIEAPLLYLEQVLVVGKGVSISSDALAECCERGIPVHFITTTGESYGAIYAAGLTGTVLTRREQLLAYTDGRGLSLAKAFTAAKISNQADTLRYLAKTRKENAPPVYEALRLAAIEVEERLVRLDEVKGDTLDDARNALMAVEGGAAQHYWEAIRAIIPDEYAWTHRHTRGATDKINCMLNYSYAILYGQVERAIVLAGLDPYAGFLHADRPGKPSLTLDMIEEFRQIAVDRLVTGLATRHFNAGIDDRGRLDEDTRRALTERVLAHLESGFRYEGKSYPLRAVIQAQARRLAAYFRGERDTYLGIKAGW